MATGSFVGLGGAGGKKKKTIGTFPIGDELVGFPSMLPGQAAVSGDLSTALVNALKGQFPEEYFSTAIAGPLRRRFEAERAPAIREEFAGPGTYWGTARAGAVGRGRAGMEEDIAGARTTLAYQTQRQALEAALAYLGIPLMAAYQPYDEGGAGGAGGSALETALQPKIDRYANYRGNIWGKVFLPDDSGGSYR